MSGALPAPLRDKANLFPVAPYYGEQGVYFVALHIRDARGESPVLLGTFGSGDLTFYAHDIAQWTVFMTRLTLEEIESSLRIHG